MRLAGVLLVLAGCGHSDPFATGRPVRQSGPFQDAEPLRLTLNSGLDTWPAWSPDGAEVWYSVQLTSSDMDRCIAQLPLRGGTRSDIQCPPQAANLLMEELEQPASDGSRLAWARSELGTTEAGPYRFTLWIARAAARSAPELVQGFPYLAPSGRAHDAPMYLQWLRPGVLLYLGAENGCCRSDTLRFGEQAVLLDLTGSSPVRRFVPGTERASAVSSSEDGTSVYYTYYGDSRVYRQVLATGDVSVLHDFGAGHIVRDPAVSGNRLVAVADGKLNYQNIVPFGLVQIDHGGQLVLVDLTTGLETRLVDSERFYKRPRLASGGTRMVAEGYPYTIVSIMIAPGVVISDTTVVATDDLWILED